MSLLLDPQFFRYGNTHIYYRGINIFLQTVFEY